MKRSRGGKQRFTPGSTPPTFLQTRSTLALPHRHNAPPLTT